MPTVIPDESLGPLIRRARWTLGWTLEELGKRVVASRKTTSRWESNDATPGAQQLVKIVLAIYPKDRGLAAQLAAQMGYSLQSLKLEAAPKPAPAPLSARPFPPLALLVEAVVCAAVEALDAKPTVVREALRVAFQRARALGLTVEEVDQALSPTAVAAAAGKKGR